MAAPVRRVVTGHDGDGKAVFVSDSLVPPVTTTLSASTAFHQLWGGDGPASLPDGGERPATPMYFPPVGGFRFGFFTLPPSGERPDPDVDIAAAFEQLRADLPGLYDFMEADAPGMHTTPTVDFEVVLSGEVTLELDDGATVTLQPGDTVVQNGTRHRWGNPGSVPATLAVFIVGAHHADFAE